ncbi:pseudouridine synthase [Streptomyces sp. A5-4]|uniref:pseudouridine synthase n=1 Tax=Streptomyces sp. A5-4 TaxID=3384771 RepID=UPI003DA9A0C1
MRSSGRNSGSSGNDRNKRGAGGGRDDNQGRIDRPRPEERRYDVGGAGSSDGDSRRGGGGTGGGGRGAAPRGGGRGGAPSGGDRGRGGPQSGGRGGAPSGGGRGGASSGGERGRGGPQSGGDRGRGGAQSGGDRGRGGAQSGGDRGRGGAPSGGERGRGGPQSGGSRSGPQAGSGRGASARGGAKGGPKTPQSGNRIGGGPIRGSRTTPARPRELDAKIEERNRERHDKPLVQTPRTHPGAEQEGERLQKVLARAGMGSRRACEELIERRRVEVNGEVVTEQGKRVDVHKDEVKVDGLTVSTQSHLFFALNKPAGVVATMGDPDGRQNLGDYVNNRETRLFHVGRLDTETEGIILLTNHGELSHRLTHPKYGVKKTYLAAIQGPLPRDLGKRLKDGIELEDGYARADHFRVVENVGKNYLVEVTLHEGRKHIVRRMLSEAGFPVEKLVRTSFGPIPLGDQKSGWLRRLTNTEVGMLMKEVGL